MTGTTAVDDFLTHLEKERDVSPNTLIAYRRDLDDFVAFLGNYYGVREWTWQGLDRLAIRGFLAHMTRRKLNKRSIGRTLSAVRSFYKYLHLNEQVEANPARGVATPKQTSIAELSRPRADRAAFQSAELKAQEGRFETCETARSSSCSTRPGCDSRSCVDHRWTSISCRSRSS